MCPKMVIMDVQVSGQVVEWRGPAPYYFLPLPHDAADVVADLAPLLSYGWGCVPVSGRLGESEFTTALIPRGDTYMLPLKVAVRRSERVEVGQHVTVQLHLGA